jgi:hypothetical protein
MHYKVLIGAASAILECVVYLPAVLPHIGNAPNHTVVALWPSPQVWNIGSVFPGMVFYPVKGELFHFLIQATD